MNRLVHLLLASICATPLLTGCPAAVVGGAATGASVAHDRRSAGVILDDQTIELKAMQLLTEHSEISEHSDIGITSYNGVVLLTGQAQTPEMSQRFAALVGGIEAVRRVVNEIEIGPVASLSQRTEDLYLTAKVKTYLFQIDVPEFDPTRIKVVTSNQVVYLMGLVTQAEAQAAVAKVRTTNGVKKVVRVFEYVSTP